MKYDWRGGEIFEGELDKSWCKKGTEEEEVFEIQVIESLSIKRLSCFNSRG